MLFSQSVRSALEFRHMHVPVQYTCTDICTHVDACTSMHTCVQLWVCLVGVVSHYNIFLWCSHLSGSGAHHTHYPDESISVDDEAPPPPPPPKKRNQLNPPLVAIGCVSCRMCADTHVCTCDPPPFASTPPILSPY